jgi:hypothetical protein
MLFGCVGVVNCDSGSFDDDDDEGDDDERGTDFEELRPFGDKCY